jgi:hypothetical protein
MGIYRRKRYGTTLAATMIKIGPFGFLQVDFICRIFVKNQQNIFFRRGPPEADRA